MKPLAFVGRVPASKSILNRLLIAQSYFPQLQVVGENQCEDVNLMRAAVGCLESDNFDAGSAGTVLRFLALRLSRVKGRHRIVGTPRLFSRPQDELLKILRQVGVRAELQPAALVLESQGWKMHGDTLLVSSHVSSQFASAVLLNAWDLPFDLYVSVSGQRVSEGYWRMTVQLAQQLGMTIDFWDSDFRVPKRQLVTTDSVTAETDMSSAFALAAIAAVNGRATLLDFPATSLQPDSQFEVILRQMGVPLQRTESTLKVERATHLNGVRVGLKGAPDLFPVLAALCALAEGESELYGAPQLVHKESNRLKNMAEWIERLGRKVELRDDGLRVLGARPARPRPLKLECDGDHRLAFAAAVWQAAGIPVDLRGGEAVNKSFPEFWNVLGWSA